jgi:predicted nucleotide-binding protein
LELGYFYGYLGWDQVFVLFRPNGNPYPRFEMPSDLAGIVYDSVDGDGRWRDALRKHLKEAGFRLNATAPRAA